MTYTQPKEIRFDSPETVKRLTSQFWKVSELSKNLIITEDTREAVLEESETLCSYLVRLHNECIQMILDIDRFQVLPFDLSKRGSDV